MINVKGLLKKHFQVLCAEHNVNILLLSIKNINFKSNEYTTKLLCLKEIFIALLDAKVVLKSKSGEEYVNCNCLIIQSDRQTVAEHSPPLRPENKMV